jgi:hypothetical protein
VEVLSRRNAVIDWAGAQHAFPVQDPANPDQVELAQSGGERAGWKRVGWEKFFTPLDRNRRVLVIDSREQFAHRILPIAQARAELPRQAFGPPFWKRLLGELWLRRAPTK